MWTTHTLSVINCNLNAFISMSVAPSMWWTTASLEINFFQAKTRTHDNRAKAEDLAYLLGTNKVVAVRAISQSIQDSGTDRDIQRRSLDLLNKVRDPSLMKSPLATMRIDWKNAQPQWQYFSDSRLMGVLKNQKKLWVTKKLSIFESAQILT